MWHSASIQPYHAETKETALLPTEETLLTAVGTCAFAIHLLRKLTFEKILLEKRKTISQN